VAAALTRDAASVSASAPEPESSPALLPTGTVLDDEDPGPKLYAIGSQTTIYARPNFNSSKIGFLRAGTSVKRSEQPVGYDGCKEGFYRIMPEGFVCVGGVATLDAQHPIVQLSRVRPDRRAALPYRYGRARLPTPVVYTKLPNTAEQTSNESDLASHRRAQNELLWTEFESSPIPELLARGQHTPIQFGYRYAPNEPSVGRALTNSAFALTSNFDVGGRRFALTTDLTLIALDRLKPIEPSAFKGVILGQDASLPVAFVKSRGAYLYQGDPDTGLRLVRALSYRDAVPLAGKLRRSRGITYLETKTGEWIRDDNVVRVEPMQSRPSWARNERTWIHVSILKQTLVAYQGERPVFVTLVSTGKDGLGDPLETHSTVRGQFLIHTKHVSTTMSGDDVGDEFDLRDVPYVQYFTEGYAFHAAYWHDGFGQPRSHGCINLSPLDARWLFHWTDPPVPQSWHSALSLRGGTLVHITP
jgi:hypothetical protein